MYAILGPNRCSNNAICIHANVNAILSVMIKSRKNTNVTAGREKKVPACIRFSEENQCKCSFIGILVARSRRICSPSFTLSILRLLSSKGTKRRHVLVFLVKLPLSPIRWVSIFQVFCHFFQLFSHHFLLTKLATSCTRANSLYHRSYYIIC